MSVYTGRERAMLDNVVGKMMQQRESAQADYRATKRSRFNSPRKGLPSMGGSADFHIKNPHEYYNLIESCYDLERNDSVVGQLTDRRSVNVIQDGFRLEPDTGDKSLDSDLKARWNQWADDPNECDIAGEACFHDFEFSADWTSTLAGDCAISLTEHGPLQFFEPYLIRNDYASRHETFLGVDLDDDRRRVRYWIAEDDVDPYNQTFTDFLPINTRDPEGYRQFFHVYDQRRTTLTRGVSAYSPIFELTGMIDDIVFAKVVQQHLVSCIAFLIEETVEAAALPSTGRTGIGADAQRPPILNQTGKIFKEVEPGMEVNAGPGKKVTGFSPQIPNPEFFQQYRQIIQLICGNLDLPLAVGMLDGSETNFHGFIGAINEAKKLWKRSQTRLIKRFHRPCFRGKLRHFAADDRHFRQAMAKLGERFFKHHWHTPIWQSVQPQVDTDDRLTRLRNAIISPSKMQAELNVDYEDHVVETVKDNAMAVREAKKEAAKINAEFEDGQPVHWGQLYPMPMPDGVQTTAQLPVIEPEVDPKQTGALIHGK